MLCFDFMAPPQRIESKRMARTVIIAIELNLNIFAQCKQSSTTMKKVDFQAKKFSRLFESVLSQS